MNRLVSLLRKGKAMKDRCWCGNPKNDKYPGYCSWKCRKLRGEKGRLLVSDKNNKRILSSIPKQKPTYDSEGNMVYPVSQEGHPRYHQYYTLARMLCAEPDEAKRKVLAEKLIDLIAATTDTSDYLQEVAKKKEQDWWPDVG